MAKYHRLAPGAAEPVQLLLIRLPVMVTGHELLNVSLQLRGK
jgi:hypothetical protein